LFIQRLRRMTGRKGAEKIAPCGKFSKRLTPVSA
jgi:hypothetical protein